MAIIPVAATINDLPEVILSVIFSFLSDVRSRNRLSLVCRRFRALERATRTSLALRGNARDLHLIPRCFGSVTHLDLSLLSPWGHALLSPAASSLDPNLLARRLRVAFPLVTSLVVYARSARSLQVLAPQWPGLRHVKLVRWHQRPQSQPAGDDFFPLFEHCHSLSTLDLSEFYYWTEDLPPVLQASPGLAKSLTKLDLLTTSFTEGFKDDEIRTITEACPNLKQFLVACRFDPRLIGFVGDEVLLAIAANCPKLTLLHVADTSSFWNTRGDPEDNGFTAEDARISRAGLIDFFSGLQFLEELVLDVCQNVRDSGLALEVLARRCPKLRALKLGQFHGLCAAVGSQLDGIALCQGLESLSIKNSADLTDMGLIEIARGCCRLRKLHIYGCKGITVKGLRTLACLLHRTLVDVSISCCKNLDAKASLQALEPICERIQRLHIDCVWGNLDDSGGGYHNFDMIDSIEHDNDIDEDEYEYERRSRKKYKFDFDAMANTSYDGVGLWSSKSWDRLEYLSLWIAVGELLSPLTMAGLEDCPNLEEIRIKIEGDCRRRSKPMEREFGLSSLTIYPKLTKMVLDCKDTIGYVLTAPAGQMDLSLWERFFLNGIGILSLDELDYWPPQDQDVNQRSLSLPAAGLMSECITLRKLFIHGTAHEHFMNFFLPMPNRRDVQLRGTYYPAPENDTSTEMRVDSCCRFEDALNSRRIDD
ncbi:F-box/LRR-repeat MAX2 homolog A [Humulus lupulus]|uniref:F-box/LRR-repeat MAX2 homolog A n=1 Tax=Humulus lupulus TaxID=3486 RepID=UPI002B40BC37|nr:F-box/LRR-repeat MAX2 homolog A [Humulus lupulus]